MHNYEKLAEIIAREGVDCTFTLLGDGNMHFVKAFEQYGAKSVYVRHEHCAFSMAMAYALADDTVGFCSVTCGPGLTQLATALPAAVRAHIPLVVLAGESPLDAAWYNQALDQGPLVAATGARYIQVHSPKQMLAQVREAFLLARTTRQPVVIGVPMDMQHKPYDGVDNYTPSLTVMGDPGKVHPDPSKVEESAQLIAGSDRIIILAGRGAFRAGADGGCRRLAERHGALLATTLPARGLFTDDPYNLGIAGGFSSTLARGCFAQADLVIAVGASLTHHTRDGGKLFPQARVIQIDTEPKGLNQGALVADLFVRGDAEVVMDALLERNEETRGPSGWRSRELACRIREDMPDTTAFPAKDGLLDPRDVIAHLDRLLPKDWEIVNSSGHCSYFSSHMYGRRAENFHTIREFGAIGNGLSYAIGVAAARPDNTVVLLDGDGSFLMHAQELDTLKRHGFKILICVLNDGAYGSEVHKLRADGLSDDGAVFGHGDMSSIARGFGIDGHVVTELDSFRSLLDAFSASSRAALLDIHISDSVTSPVMRRNHPPKRH